MRRSSHTPSSCGVKGRGVLLTTPPPSRATWSLDLGLKRLAGEGRKNKATKMRCRQSVRGNLKLRVAQLCSRKLEHPMQLVPNIRRGLQPRHATSRAQGRLAMASMIWGLGSGEGHVARVGGPSDCWPSHYEPSLRLHTDAVTHL